MLLDRPYLASLLLGTAGLFTALVVARPTPRPTSPDLAIALPDSAVTAAPVVHNVEPEPAPPPGPHLDTRCIAGDAAANCDAPHGFPAISADGTTIVTELVPDDGGRGNLGLHIQFFDAKTAKLTKTIVVLDPDEYDPEAPKQVAAKIASRVDTVQTILRAGHYRSLLTPSDSDGVHVDVAEDTATLLDGPTTLWKHRYLASAAFPGMGAHYDPEKDMCHTVDTYGVQLWWDAPTKTIVTLVDYSFGPSCMCGETSQYYVNHAR